MKFENAACVSNYNIFLSVYTILANKKAKGDKGAIVAMVEGTISEAIINVITKIPQKERAKVSEITLDMAGSMNLVAKRCFFCAEQVIDRFHVQKLAFTNASAESFNAKIKAFRSTQRGVRDVNFFLFRLTKIYA